MPRLGWADQKSDDIQTLLRLTHSDLDDVTKRNDRSIGILMQRFIDLHPDLTDAQVQQLKTVTQNFSRRLIAGIESELSSGYERRLSDANIRATITFLESADGQAYMKATRKVRRDVSDNMRQRRLDLIRGLTGQYLSILKLHPSGPSIAGPRVKT